MEKKPLTIGFYNPYYDGLGGGERYTLTLASHWSEKHDVSIFWDDPNILGEAETRFGLDLTRVRVIPNIFKNANIFSKLWKSRTFDLIFFVSDGSIPASMARHNILHFQVPFPSVLVDPWKIKRYDAIVCNSEFTRRELDPQISERAMVVYPPVHHIPPASSVKKKHMILSVGRFTSYAEAKKQEVLISAFKKGLEQGILSGWELVLAGGLLPSDRDFFARLEQVSKGLPITVLPNISNERLVGLYQQSRIYWHAAGFKENNPMHMEHFGITTVEAMSAGLIPVVYRAGGQLEIITEGKDGLFWETEEELIKKTATLVRDSRAVRSLAQAAVARSEEFGTRQFTRGFDAIIAGWEGA